MKKVFPEEKVFRDRVEVLVDDVQQQIDQITMQTNQWARQLYDNTLDNVNLAKKGAPTRRDKEISPRFHANGDLSEVTDIESTPVQPFLHADSSEDIKLSHEILNDREVTKRLTEKSNLLQSQLEENTQVLQKLNNRLKERETKYSDLETKLHRLQEEKINLEEELKKRPAAVDPLFPTNPVNANNANKLKERDDLQKRSEELRKQLLFANDEEDVVVKLDDFFRGKSIFTLLQELFVLMMPLRRDIRTIQGIFGTSVASYFSFYRFLFLQAIFIGAIEFTLLMVHISNLTDRGSLSITTLYSFSGQLPYILAPSSFASNEGLLYNGLILVPLVVILLTTCWKLASEDKIAKHLDAMDQESTRPFSKEILVAWDNAISTPVDADEQSGSLANKFLQMIDEFYTAGKKKQRSQVEILKINLKRFSGMVYYLILVGTSFAVIIYVTIYSAQISASASQISFLRNFTPFIVTLILNFINGVMPMILQKLTEKESWDSASTVAYIVLFRLYISHLLNALILAASYIVLSDPFLLANEGSLRNSISVQESAAFDCRLDQAGSGLFVLIVVTWALDLFFFWLNPIGEDIMNRLMSTKKENETGGNKPDEKKKVTSDLEKNEDTLDEAKEEKDNDGFDNRRAISREGNTIKVARRRRGSARSVKSELSVVREMDNKGDTAKSGDLKDEKKETKKTEFDVSEHMIKRLNFVGLCLMALPYCPALYAILPILIYVGFKMEKFLLKRFYSKPTRQWKGQKAGFLYTSLYLFSFLSLGVTASSYFFLSKTFAKSCDIQDNSVGLCVSGTFDATTNLCTVDPSSDYYSFYGASGNYPASICNDACGPFIHDSRNISPLISLISSNYVSSLIWTICFSYPYLPWVSCLVLVMIILLRNNSVEVMKILSFNKERIMEAQIVSLEAERKKQLRIIDQLKAIERDDYKEE